MMRYFSGTRDMSKKKGAASEQYKAQLNARNNQGAVAEDPMRVYKKGIEARMAKIMEDILLGKRKSNAALPGVSTEDKPKEVSKGTLLMLRMLAERRDLKERKDLRKREIAFQREQKAKKALEKQQQLAAELLLQQKETEYQAEKAAAHAYWSSKSEESNSSWW